MKVLSIFGTRPEAIKMAPLVIKLRADRRFEDFVCVTGQHREMLDQVLRIFSLKPDYDLNLMKPGQNLSELTAKILESVGSVLDQLKPDIVLVHGDTTSALAGALAAYYKKIPVGHVEAGLRTGNLYSPWPEEANRKLIGALASVHFAPTAAAKNNLLKEGVNRGRIFLTGNTVIDAIMIAKDYINKNLGESTNFKEMFSYLDPKKDMVLITGHRRENFGSGFQNICDAILKLSERHPNINFVYPVHLNPSVSEPVHKILKDKANIHLIAPLDYLSFVYLLNLSKLVLTDSGGIQEEAPAFGKPVLVMRDTTERPEGIEAGTAILVGTRASKIFGSVHSLLTDEKRYTKMCLAANPYGDGNASLKILETLACLSD